MICPDCDTKIDTMERCRCEEPHPAGSSSAPDCYGSGYRLSRDYAALFRLISRGMVVAAFVDYRFRGDDDLPAMRDICKVQYRGPWQITMLSRGMGYAGVDTWLADRGEDEVTVFSKICESANLEWIEP